MERPVLDNLCACVAINAPPHNRPALQRDGGHTDDALLFDPEDASSCDDEGGLLGQEGAEEGAEGVPISWQAVCVGNHLSIVTRKRRGNGSLRNSTRGCAQEYVRFGL